MRTTDAALPSRVLHVEAGRHLYGGPRQVLYLMAGLHGRGVDNVLACPKGAEYAQAARDFASVVELPMRGDLDLPLIGRLRRLIVDTRPELVHLHSRRGADVLGGLAARRAGIPAILSRRVDNAEPAWLCRWKYGLYTRVVAISGAIREVLLSQGVPAGQIVCVPSAVDATPYLAEPDMHWFRAEFDLANNAPVIGMAAQFIPRKGHGVLLDALPAVLERHPDVQVLLFGRGPLEQSVADAIRDRGLSGSVRMTGYRHDLERLLPCLDMLVHPASAEGLGVVLLQAGASAIPVIAGRAGGIPEVVRDGETGLLVPPNRPDDLAAAIVSLLDDTDCAQRFGQAGRRRVQEYYSAERMVDGNLAVYRDALAR